MTTEIETNLEALMAVDVEDGEPFTLNSEPLCERRGRRIDPESRRFNVALHRICKGKYDIGGVCHELAVITGLSEDAIRSRVSEAEYGYHPEPLEPGTGLNSDDHKYLMSRYGSVNDPSVRDFLQRINGTQRKSPDHEDARVRRQRIRQKDGTSRLISVSIDLPRN